MPIENNEILAAATVAVSEPVRAALLATALATVLSLKSSERSLGKRFVEVLAVGMTGLVAGYCMQSFGLEAWAIWSGNAVIAYLGTDKVRSIIDRVVDKFLDNKGA